MKPLFPTRLRRARWTLAFSIAVIPLLVGVYASPTLGNILYYNFADHDDHKKFPSRPLTASPVPFHFQEAKGNWKPPATLHFQSGETQGWDALLDATETLAFLVIHKDRILYENYRNGHAQNAHSISFSIAKSFLSALVGKALEDGHIVSLDQPVTDYVPEFAGREHADFTVKQLLQMTTGMDYTERALINNPFGMHARLYYTPSLEREILSLKFKEKAGQRFQYKSGEFALLGLVLSRALGDVTITEYLQETIWNPIGMESPGLVNVDRKDADGIEKMWCCMGVTARDLAKFGRLYLNGGSWEGRQVLPGQWVRDSTKVDDRDGSSKEYQYGWWILPETEGVFQAEGLYGQYIHVNPKTQTLIVRLGKSRGPITREQWIEVFASVSNSL